MVGRRSDAIALYQQRKSEMRALKGSITKLKDAFGEMPAADLTPQIIDQWLTDQSEWSPATRTAIEPQSASPIGKQCGIERFGVILRVSWHLEPRRAGASGISCREKRTLSGKQ